jgi:hypothetical protein
MSEAQIRFEAIRDEFTTIQPQVEAGKMMSSPALTYRGKVFAFYHGEEMIFKMGKDYDPVQDGIQTWALLNPFKHKPPMAGWFRIGFEDQARWEMLARKALERMIKEMNG